MNRTTRHLLFAVSLVALPLVAQNQPGSVTAWGDNVSSTPVAVALPPGVSIYRIDAGVFDTIAIANDELTVYTWSGVGNAADAASTPTQVVLPADVTCVTAVAAGEGHFLALTNAADLYAWGNNSHGQLGDGTTTSRATPAKVIFPPSVISITGIAAGYLHSLAMTNDGVYAWGHNSQGDLGDGTLVNRSLPVKVLLPASVIWTSALSAGFMDSFAITNDGLYAWGYNFFGQLGDGTTVDKSTPVKIAFPKNSNGNGGGTLVTSVEQIAAGEYHVLAITNDGLYAWGQNINGTLGDGTFADKSVPVKVKFPKAVYSVSAIAAGTFHSLAVTNDGLYSWGNDVAGVLGSTPNKKKIGPARVPSENNAVAVGAGEYTSVALH